MSSDPADVSEPWVQGKREILALMTQLLLLRPKAVTQLSLLLLFIPDE